MPPTSRRRCARIGFDVVEGRDLDRRAMEDTIREFGRKLDRADVALFFYAGHGLQVGGRNYLVPIDAKLERPGDLNLRDRRRRQVRRRWKRRSGPICLPRRLPRQSAGPHAGALARHPLRRVGNGLASIQSAVGTMIAYATQPDNVALDGDGRNSPFTAAVLKHIATPGLEITSLMKRVRSDVVAATRDRQVPGIIPRCSATSCWSPATARRRRSRRPRPPAALAPPPAAAPPVPAPGAKPRTAVAPAFTKNVLTAEPAIGKLGPGATVLVDDGTCPAGQVKQLTGGNMAKGQARLRSCVPRN